jgi:hypothetical protein
VREASLESRANLERDTGNVAPIDVSSRAS